MKVSSLESSAYMINYLNKYQSVALKSVEKLATGKQINRASDSPHLMLRMSRLESQIRGNNVAQKNLQDAISLTQTASSSLDYAIELGQKLRELSVRYQNDTLDDAEKQAIREEATALLNEMHHAISNTKFNGINVFEKEKFVIQAGANSGDKYEITMPKQLVLQQYGNHLNKPQSEPRVQEGVSLETFSLSAQNEAQIHAQPDVQPLAMLSSVEGVSDNEGKQVSIEKSVGGQEDVQVQGLMDKQDVERDAQAFAVSLKSDGVKHELGHGIQLQSQDTSNKDGKATIQSQFAVASTTGFLERIGEGIVGIIGGILDRLKCFFGGKWGNNPQNPSDTGNMPPNNPVDIPELPNQNPNPIDTNPPVDNPSNSAPDNTLEDPSVPGTQPNVPDEQNGQPDVPSDPGSSPDPTQPGTEVPNVPKHPVPNEPEEDPWKEVLNPDFIDRNLLNPLNEARMQLGIHEAMLERRLDFESNKELVLNHAMSTIQDVDMAKELVNKIRYETMAQSTLALLHQNLDNHRAYVLKLLS